MARHGENIRKRKDGRWEGRYPMFDGEKGKRIYRSIYGSTYEDVRDKLNVQKKRQEAMGRGRIRIRNSGKGSSSLEKVLFTKAAEQWLEEIQNTKKPSTYVKYKLIYQKYLKPMFFEAEVSAITDDVVWEQIPEDLTDSVKKSIYCVLNQILKFAVRQYLIPMPNLQSPSVNMRNKPVIVLTRKEQMKLLSVLKQDIDPFKTAIALSLYTGLRLGEICALKWTDIDAENRLVTVNRTVQRLKLDGHRSKTILLETDPKSEYSKREIPLSNTVFALLTQFSGKKEYIFGGGKPMDPRTMQNHFKRLLQSAGLPDRNFHILRHTFATNCIEGGTDVKSLSEILGHSDVQITLNRYVHPSMDTKRKYMDVLSLFYGQIYGQDYKQEEKIEA